MKTETLRRELHINWEIDGSMNNLLMEMQRFVDNTRIWESGMKMHQMTNLVAVAGETGSVEVVKNFIRYQIGRDTRNDNWRWRVGSVKNFGEQLVDRLDELREMAEGIVARASDLTMDQRDMDRIWMTLCRAYLGHLSRYFYYKKETAEGGGR